MKNAIFLLALLFGVAFADECTYQTDENTYFTFLSTWSNVTDSKGNLFFFQDGCFGFAETNPCPENSPVCVILNGASDPISTAVTYSVDTSISQDQVQFVFTSETSCFSESIGEKATMKTTISFNCDMMNEVVTVTFDGCFVVINANSSTYCSDSDNYDSDSDFESGSFPSNASVDIEPGVVFFVLLDGNLYLLRFWTYDFHLFMLLLHGSATTTKEDSNRDETILQCCIPTNSLHESR